jgi:hypothetical protein
VGKEEVICGIHRKTVERVKCLCESLRTNIVGDEIIFLNVLLGKEQLSKEKVGRLFELCYRVTKEHIRNRMLRVIFESLIKSPTMNMVLKKDVTPS